MAVDIDWSLLGQPNALLNFYKGQDAAQAANTATTQNALLQSQLTHQGAVNRREDTDYDQKKKLQTLDTLDQLTSHIQTPEQLEEAKANPQIRALLPADFDLSSVTMDNLTQLRQAAAALRKPVAVAEGTSLVDPRTGQPVFSAAPKPIVVGDSLVDPKTGNPIYTGQSKPVVVDGIAYDPKTGQPMFGPPKIQEAGGDVYQRPGVGPSPAGPAAPGAQPPPSGPVAPAGTATGALGDRNNNPLNVKALPNGRWVGQTGVDPSGYVQFDRPESGWQAADTNLQAYNARHGINTVAGIVNRWAPAGDGANNPQAYAATVAGALGVKPDTPINLADPGVRRQVLTAMAGVELGHPAQAPGQATQPAGPAAAGAAQGGLNWQRLPRDTAGDLTPEAIDYVAEQYMATGQLPPMGMGGIATRNRDAVINRAQQIEAETGMTGKDAVLRHVQTKTDSAALNKITTLRRQIEASENTVKANADYALGLAPKGGGPTGSPMLNTPIQAFRKQAAGSPDVAQFDQALGTVADEYAKVMSTNTGSGGQTSDSARNEAYRRLSSSATFGQLKSTITAMQTEMTNRVKSYKDQEDQLQTSIRGSSSKSPATDPSRPAVRTGYTVAQRQYELQNPQTGDAGSASKPFYLPSADADAHYSHLPKGAHYVGPDGVLRVK